MEIFCEDFDMAIIISSRFCFYYFCDFLFLCENIYYIKSNHLQGPYQNLNIMDDNKKLYSVVVHSYNTLETVYQNIVIALNELFS